MGELELIGRIRARLAGQDPKIRIGIGDDAAVLASLARPTVSVDAIVEGVHFDRRWLTWHDVGFRGYAAALSDLAAMGAAPVAGFLAFVLPRALGDDDVLAIVGGAAEAAAEFGAPIAGGNVSSGTELSMTTTVVGEAPAAPLSRGGARIGDAIYTTGTVGAAALGLRLVARGVEHALVERWRRPRPRFDLAPALLGRATSAIDVSDGLLLDLGHVCEESRVGAVVELARLPLADEHRALARSIGEDPDALALGGGEDYEIVFTAPRDDTFPATRIGEIVAGAGAVVVGHDGREVSIARPGHLHR